MAVDTAAIIATYEAEYTANAAKLAALPAMDFSDQGRSVSATSARESLTKRQEWLAQQLAALGAPIGTLAQPFAVASVWRP